MKRVFMIHGWGGSPETDWFIWLKKELKNNYYVNIPEMPESFRPTIKAWISKLKATIEKIDEETILIGHSIGCQAILRYLETLPNNEKAKGIIMVAPWLKLNDETWDEDYTKEIAEQWINTPLNFRKIKEHTKNFISIFSNDDPYVSIEDSKIFEKELNAKVIIEKNKGHFSGEDGVTKLPVVLKEILRISRK